ncbi:MAG TPA: phosphate uptake regulator PhoU [Candidatus Caldiarchaeum subterraneum]|uniref:Phosphate uptake regulator PhoU n=1 Tax=Caldiarchaeum subterraneum TaxID=311458 RepID=A0A832ZWP4_CALS0|nr:phosphate uptake regulator PhoU [Aigarchaeota archaeon]HIQ30219.1 phosphate uptake regulator PhoU [Candidatus Caldarchaeum subterraneum]
MPSLKTDYVVRRIQKTGGSTLIVSLPKEWTERMKLRKFDEIIIVPTSDGVLHIIPKAGAGENNSSYTLVVRENEKAENILRDYIAAYLVGYTTIRIKFREEQSGLSHSIRQLIRRWLIGVEVVEETRYEMVTQCLPMHTSLPLRKAMERMGSIASSMQREAINALEELDKGMAADIQQRDDEVDRFYHFIVRQLNLAVSNPVILNSLGLQNKQDCLGYMLVTKSVERAADHASSIAGITTLLPNQRNVILSRIAELGYKANSLFNESLDALMKNDKDKAKNVISNTLEETNLINQLYLKVLGKTKSPLIATSYRLILENIRRIAEYSSDISEVVVNLAIEKPTSLTHY